MMAAMRQKSHGSRHAGPARRGRTNKTQAAYVLYPRDTRKRPQFEELTRRIMFTRASEALHFTTAAQSSSETTPL